MKMIIVDTNTWPSVFSEDACGPQDFSAVKQAIISGGRKLAWGGTKYFEELRRCPRYLGIHLELGKSGKSHRFDSHQIDLHEIRIRAIELDPDFDDAHLIALEIVAKTGLIVTADKRCHRFVKKAKLYPKKFRRPKIYTCDRQKKLLDI